MSESAPRSEASQEKTPQARGVLEKRMSGLIVSQQSAGDFRVDSRDMAERLGNQHRNVMALIERNVPLFEGFGPLAFHLEVRAGQEKTGGGLPTRYAMLNEDQCYYLLALVRNSKKVAALKAALIQSFKEARQAIALPAPVAAFDMATIFQQMAATVLAPFAAQTVQTIKAEADAVRLELRAEMDSRAALQPINSFEKGCIYKAVRELGRLMGGSQRDYAKAWTTFKDRYGLAAYGDLPGGLYAEAMAFVQELCAAYAPPQTLKFGGASA